MISDKYKLIFIHIPKTGGSSVEKALINIFDEKIRIDRGNTYVADKNGKQLKRPIKNSYNTIKHATATELINQYGEEKFKEYHKFTIIRNPWDRLLSLYRWGATEHYMKHNFLNKLPKTNVDSNLRTKWTINKYICDEKNNLLVDTILNFENLNEEFNNFTSEIGLDVKLPHINKSKNSNGFKDVMDDEVINKIKDLYKTEINKFWVNYL